MLLRLFLGYTAVGWGICLAGVFVSGSYAFDLLSAIGGIDVSALRSEPMFHYWLRMASSVFAFVGIVYGILAIWPQRLAFAIPFAGWFMVAEGVILLVHGLLLDLAPMPLRGDVAFCLTGGLGILICGPAAWRT